MHDVATLSVDGDRDMSFQDIIMEKRGPVAKITLNRPQVLNALRNNLKLELISALGDIANDESVRVVVITGAGDKAFSAGADVTELQQLTSNTALEFNKSGLNAMIRAIETLPKPVIAAVNGYALGGGCELAMGCDIILASENAKFGQPEIKLGIIPGAGGTQRLPRLIGPKKANLLLYTGDMIDAKEAERLGLVSQVVPSGALNEAVDALIAKMLSQSPATLALIKKAAVEGMKTEIDTGIGIEGNLFSLCFATEDQKEGMKAFLEKRKPEWKGR